MITYSLIFRHTDLKNEILSAEQRSQRGTALSRFAFFYCWGTSFVTVMFPVGLLLYWAFDPRVTYIGDYTSSFLNTFLLATCVGLSVLAFSLTYHFLLKKIRGGGWWLKVSQLTHIGYAVPGPVLAIGGLGLAAQLSTGVSWPLSFGILVGVLGTKFLLLAKETAGEKLRRQPSSWSEASQSLGVSIGKQFWRLDLPYLRTPMGVAFLIVAVEVMKEMPITLMLSPLGFRTFSMDIFNYTMEGEWQKAAVPALTLVVMGLLPVLMVKGRELWRK